jgi:predicted metal-dependent peptidase
MFGTEVSVETKLKRANIQVLRDKRTIGIGSTVLLGTNEVVGDAVDCPTAYTDGRNKFYGEEFCKPLSPKQMVYLVLHENMHVFTMDIPLLKDLWEDDPQLANVAADYVNNGIIENMGIDDLIERPPGALIDSKFNGWSKREVYRFLKTGRNKDGKQEGQPKPGGNDGQGNPTKVQINGRDYSIKPMDEHGFDEAKDMGEEDVKQLAKEIEQAVRQAVMIAGTQGQDVPRAIRELLVPKVNWGQELQDFLNTMMRGDDDISFRRYDKRYLADDGYMPTTYTERLGTLLICMDTSGSTQGKPFDTFCGGLQSIIERVRPERIRVLHWDTNVAADQTLDEQDYTGTDIRTFLTPRGGGGTCVSNCANYIQKHNVNADCCIVFTDGHLESHATWPVSIPTMWLITDNEQFVPPSGRRLTVSA